MTIRSKLCRKKAFVSSFFTAAEESGECFILGNLCDVGSSVFLDYCFESMVDLYAINVLSFPRGPPYKGHGYPRWPNGRSPTTIKLLLQQVNNDSNVFRRVGIGILPGSINSDYGPDEEEEMTPLTWLLMDEEVFEDKTIVII